MKMNHVFNYCLGIISVLCLLACQTGTVYFNYEPIAEEGWSKTDTLHYYLPDSLSLGTYQLAIGVRHSGKYPYRDLWLELTQHMPNTKGTSRWKEHRDTIHIYLANEKGNWNGTGTTSGYYQLLTDMGDITIMGNDISEEQVIYASNENKDYFDKKAGKLPNENEKQIGIRARNEKRKKYTFKGKAHTLGKKANYHLKITQIMSDSLLLNVSDIGIRLTR